jgi:predicted TIM-barrel fold metal-dependent hydrolase
MSICAIDSHVHIFNAAFGGGPEGGRAALMNALYFRPDILDYFEKFRYSYFIRKNNPLIYAVEKLIMLAVGARMKNSSIEALASSMQAAGVRYSVIHPVYPYVTTEEVYNMCDFKAFFPFCSPPVDRQDCLLQAESDLSRGCLGIKIHPLIQGLDLDAAAYIELAGLAAERKVPMVAHFGGTPAMFGLKSAAGHLEARKLRKLALYNNNLALVAAHFGLWQNEEVLEQIKDLDNVYADTSFQSPAFIKKAAGVIGSKRILLGSDFPIGNQKLCRDNVLAAGLTDSQTEDILFKNSISIMNFNKSKNNYYTHLANNIR